MWLNHLNTSIESVGPKKLLKLGKVGSQQGLNRTNVKKKGVEMSPDKRAKSIGVECVVSCLKNILKKKSCRLLAMSVPCGIMLCVSMLIATMSQKGLFVLHVRKIDL